MKIKQAILALLARDDLKKILDDLEIVNVDRRSVEGMDARLAGQEMKTVVGNPIYGSPSRSILKRIVREIKELAKEYAGDDEGFYGKWSGRWAGNRQR